MNRGNGRRRKGKGRELKRGPRPRLVEGVLSPTNTVRDWRTRNVQRGADREHFKSANEQQKLFSLHPIPTSRINGNCVWTNSLFRSTGFRQK